MNLNLSDFPIGLVAALPLVHLPLHLPDLVRHSRVVRQPGVVLVA